MEPKKLNQIHPMNRAGTVARVGALISAVLASACCWLPLLLIAFGVSGDALSAKFEVLRPVVLPLTFVLLGMAFYFTYRKPKAVAAAPLGTGETCCTAPGMKEDKKGFTIKKLNKVMLWVVTVFVLAFAFFPNYAGFFLRGNEAAPAQAGANRIEWTMKIDGMACQACATHIASELRKIPGVSEANIDYGKGLAVVFASPAVSESDLRKAVEATGYTVSSLEEAKKTRGKIQQ
ncbi:MAG: mercuric transporter MerT family protein [Syntrophobacteraceae bacterium]